MEEETIGKRIAKEVRKQEWDITKFADAICCKRNNVYNIFKRNNIDIQLLANISKVLKHNFFDDLANNPKLAYINENESEKDTENRRAVAQFFEVMPNILTRIGMNNRITFTKYVESNENDVPNPDIILPDYLVCFTIGKRWIEKAKMSNSQIITVKTMQSKNSTPVDIIENKIFNSVFIDIALNYKTEQEWETTMRFVKDECMKYVKLSRKII